MQEITATMTARGQVTIPVEVQRHLGLRPRDKLTFAIDRDSVRLVSARFTVETAAGSVEPPTSSEDLEQVIAEAKQEHADKVIADLAGR
jgi:bifunctional DNA-binding transcriptional regulator/antitoxin component of YhaV-PrlF toxin-antitoxin module